MVNYLTSPSQFPEKITPVGGASAAFPFIACSPNSPSARRTDYSRLDVVLKQPVLRRELFPDPVILTNRNLLLSDGSKRKGGVPVEIAEVFGNMQNERSFSDPAFSK